MNSESNIIEIDGDKYKKSGITNPDKKINPKNFNLYNDGIRLGIAAGVAMALFLIAAQLMTMGESMVLKFFKYMALGGVLLYGLNLQKSYLRNNYQFEKGIQLGAILTSVSAATLAIINMIMFWTTDNLAFDKFSLEADSAGNAAVLSGVLFFEVLVFGMIITFIILQGIKPKRKGTKLPK